MVNDLKDPIEPKVEPKKDRTTLIVLVVLLFLFISLGVSTYFVYQNLKAKKEQYLNSIQNLDQKQIENSTYSLNTEIKNLVDQRKYDEAFSKIIALSQDVQPELLYYGSFNANQNRDFEAALKFGLKLIELAPNDNLNQSAIGWSYVNLGEYQKAEEHLLKSIELDPNHPWPHNNLGVLYEKLGKFDLAEKKYKEWLNCYMEINKL